MITGLDIMGYLDPASDPGSKLQRLSVRKGQISTSDKLQTFKNHFLEFL